MPATSQRSAPFLPTGRGWWLVAAGIAAGIAVFLVLWSGQRDARDLSGLDDAERPAAAAPAFRPLPVPPDSGLRATDAPELPPTAARLEEPPAPPSRAAAAAQVPPATTAAPGGPASAPVPVSSPGPRYPARSLRRGESGQVLLRVQVDARGLPARVDVASSSGSRDLDRAASRAVRRWRFQPAMQDGQPVPGVVNVPVTFDSGR